MDGLQEVKLYLRTLLQIIENLLRHLGYRDLQYLHFEYREFKVSTYSDEPRRQYLCSNAMQRRNWRKRLPIRNELNACLTARRKPRDDER